MATFPSWISKRNHTNSVSQNLSPRQMANKAHSLAIKKLDKDDKRKRPQYSIRERLLLSKTMSKAEEVLNKKPTMYRSAVSFDDDDIMPPFKSQSVAASNSKNNPSDSASTLEQIAAVSLVVVTVVASLNNSINENPQKSQDFCRTIMIPPHPSSLTTII